MMKLFGRAYLKIQRRYNAVSGIKTICIYSVNRDVFSSEGFITSTLTNPKSQAVTSTNEMIPCSSTNSDSSQPCSSKSLDAFVLDASKATNFVLPLEISPSPPPKKKNGEKSKSQIEAEKLNFLL